MADEHRAAVLFKRLDLTWDVEVVGERLAKAKVRVDDHPGHGTQHLTKFKVAMNETQQF